MTDNEPMLFERFTVVGTSPGPRLLILAGVHGDEPEPMVAVKRLRRLLGRLSIRGEVTLVPTINRSAWRCKARTGEDGLDLARTFPGRADGDITERVAYEAARLIRAADYLIDLHTGGKRLRLWPLAGYLLHPQSDVLDEQRALARAFNLPVVWGTSPALDGRTLSEARDANVPAIYVEYLGAMSFSRAAVTAMVDGCLNVMAHFRMIERAPQVDRVQFQAEQGGAGAGHLQASQPAPVAGMFSAAVELGKKVALGDTLGWLAPHSSAEELPIAAEQGGRIVCLRVDPQVEPGDGLAVIVPFDEE